MPSSIRHLKATLATGVALGAALLAQAAAGAPTAYTRPNVVTNAGASSVTLNGQTFVNQGLQGAARLPASTTRDFNGDTFGAFSGMDVVPGSWRLTPNGYTGVLYSLPDRGPNGIGTVSFSDYAGRVSRFDMNFQPYTSATVLPAAASSQQQLTLTQSGGFFFKDFNGRVTTGLDPGAGPTAFVTQNGMQLPGSTAGAAAGKISLDAEGLRFLSDGSFYVSDEYGANVYYFDPAGNMKGVIPAPPALTARNADGTLSYTSLTDAATGRRLNQGLEGIAVTPDGRKLVSLLQSAAMQDSTSAQQTRTNTRLMIYDISQTRAPTSPVADYVVQLPVFTANGDGAAVNRTAAQSEILALNDTQFLVLARDGNGLGQAKLNPVFKSILLIDTTGATNIAGTAFETSATPIAPGGTLNPTITPVSQVEVVNILNTTQLGKFGINIDNVNPTRLTLTEKLEGMALLPVLDENAPQDFFLLIGNDNDFLSTTCSVGGQDCAQAVDSDALVLVYRLTLPTYVDSQYLLALQEAGGETLGMTALVARESAVTNADNIGQRLVTLRHAAALPGAGTRGLWFTGNGSSRDESGETPESTGMSGTLGFDAALDERLTVGIAAGYFRGDAGRSGGFDADYDGYQFSLYGNATDGRLYVNGSASWGRLDFDSIRRPGAYGLGGEGSTDGDLLVGAAEVGYLLGSEGVRFGPLAGFRWLETDIDGYGERGASGGNLVFGDSGTSDVSGYLGGEASFPINAAIRAIARLTYNTETDADTSQTLVRLAGATSAMGSQLVEYSTYAQAWTEPSLMLSGPANGPVFWWFNYGAKLGADDGTEHRVTAGFRWQF